MKHSSEEMGMEGDGEEGHFRSSSDREKGERIRLEKEKNSLSNEIDKLKKELIEKEKEKKEAADRYANSNTSLLGILKSSEDVSIID